MVERKQPRRQSTRWLAAGTLAAGLVLAGGAQAEMKGMIIGSGSVGADFFSFGSALQQALAAEFPDLAFENTATSGSVENVRLLHRGEVDVAIFQISDATTGALTGSGRFEGEEPYDDLRAIGTLFDFKYYVIVPADSDIRSIEDLRGASIAVGPDPATQDVHAAPLFEAHGIDYENDLERFYASYADVFRQLAEGRVDAAMGYTSGFIPLPAIQELLASTEVRWLGWDPDKLRANGIVPVRVPGGTLPGQDDEIYAAQRGLNILAGTDDLSDEQAHELARVLHQRMPEIAELVPALRANLNEPTSLAQSTGPFPYHPGALAYWRDAGPMK
jgi:TRAP transporter TAXI family solute receptor